MRFFLLLSFALLYGTRSFSQNTIIDSLKETLKTEKTDTGKAIILYNLSYYYQKYKPDSALLLARRAFQLSKEASFLKGQSNSLGQIAGAFNRLGNYPEALEYYIEQLKIEEIRNSPEGIASVYLNIALVYDSETNQDKSLFYAYKADSIVRQYKFHELLLYTSLNIGNIYTNINKLDSALYYTTRCYEASVQQKNDLIAGTALNNLGNIYFKLGNLQKAINSYKSSIPFFEHLQDYNTLAECQLGLARTYERTGTIDSAFYFAQAAYKLASANQFLQHALSASDFLSHLYKQKRNFDSAFAYQETMLVLKDSIDNREKIRQSQNITIREQIRQNEIEEMKLQQSKERRQKLQLLAIGIFIPICFFISIFISRRKVHKKVIEFSGIFSILMFFEYLTLFIHPFVAEITHHSPLYEIIILVAIAAFLTPSHHKIEHWLISRLSKINSSRLELLARKAEESPAEEEKCED
ncbi:MAG: tetratricopeptide repeat protein [Segetibacter sp.]|nr:tetratricopeptide repeat protein [Segetibacter sp.]